MITLKKILWKFSGLLVATVIPFLTVGLVYAEGNNFAAAQKTWQNFTSCGKIKGEAAIDKCLNESLTPGMDRLPRQKMEEYILMDFKFSDLHVCDERDKVQPLKSRIPIIYYCLSVLGHRSQAQGYATFEKDNTELRLKSIRYDF